MGHVVILEKMKFWHYGPFQDDYSFRDGTILTSLTGEDGTWEEIHFIQRTPSNVTMSIYADNRDDNGEWEEYNIAANKQFPSRYYRLVTSIEPDQGIVFLHECIYLVKWLLHLLEHILYHLPGVLEQD